MEVRSQKSEVRSGLVRDPLDRGLFSFSMKIDDEIERSAFDKAYAGEE